MISARSWAFSLVSGLSWAPFPVWHYLCSLILTIWSGYRAKHRDRFCTRRGNKSNHAQGMSQKFRTCLFCFVGRYCWFDIVQKFKVKLEFLIKQIEPLREGMRQYSTQITTSQAASSVEWNGGVAYETEHVQYHVLFMPLGYLDALKRFTGLCIVSLTRFLILWRCCRCEGIKKIIECWD